jgi:hypothetical protein
MKCELPKPDRVPSISEGMASSTRGSDEKAVNANDQTFHIEEVLGDGSNKYGEKCRFLFQAVLLLSLGALCDRMAAPLQSMYYYSSPPRTYDLIVYRATPSGKKITNS